MMMMMLMIAYCKVQQHSRVLPSQPSKDIELAMTCAKSMSAGTTTYFDVLCLE